MNAALVEYVGGIQVIKAFGQGSKSFGEFSRSVNFFHDSTLPGGGRAGFGWRASRRCSPPLYWARCPWERGSICRARWSWPLFLACIIIPFGFMAGLIKFGFALGQLSYMAPNLDPIQTSSTRRSSAGLKSR